MGIAMQEFMVGQKVRVVQTDAKPWTADWQKETFVVVGVQWEYQRAGGDGVNYSLATQDEINNRLGSTDGFTADLLRHA